MITVREYNIAVKEFSRNIFRYVFKCLRDKEASEDVVQNCYLKLWEHRENVHPGKIKHWLFVTAHNTMLNYVRKNSKSSALPPDLHRIEPYIDSTSQFELKELIDQALDLLPQIQKTIVLLRDLEGYDYKEIGEILELSESQVKVYLFRGRQKLKTALKEFQNYYEKN